MTTNHSNYDQQDIQSHNKYDSSPNMVSRNLISGQYDTSNIIEAVRALTEENHTATNPS